MSYDTAMKMMGDIRKSKHVTLRELGEKAGISPTRLCRIESGERVVSSIDELATIFDTLELSKEERRQLVDELTK